MMRKTHDTRLLYAWWITLISIACLSVWGRALQTFARTHFNTAEIGWTIKGLLAAIAVYGFIWARRQNGWRSAAPILILAPLALSVQYVVPLPEERLHLLMFGILGFLGARCFTWKTTLVAGLVASFMDEGLQSLLPNRYGALGDVLLNLIGYSLGAWVASRGVVSEKQTPHSR